MGSTQTRLMLAFSGVMAVAAIVTARRTRQTQSAEPAKVLAGARLRAYDATSVEVAAHDECRTLAAPVSMTRLLAAGVAVGAMTGFFGVGGGFVIVPALVLLLGVPMSEAVGTSLLIIAINSAVAFGLKSRGVHLDWTIIAVFTAAAVVGATAGGRVAQRLDGVTLSRWFTRMVLIVAAYTAVRSMMGLLGA